MRDVNNDLNRILIEVPVHVLNLEHVAVGITRDITFVLHLNGVQEWTTLHPITISAEAETPEDVQSPKFIDFTLANAVDNNKVTAGDAAVLRVELEFAVGWTNATLELRASILDGNLKPFMFKTYVNLGIFSIKV